MYLRKKNIHSEMFLVLFEFYHVLIRARKRDFDIIALLIKKGLSWSSNYHNTIGSRGGGGDGFLSRGYWCPSGPCCNTAVTSQQPVHLWYRNAYHASTFYNDYFIHDNYKKLLAPKLGFLNVRFNNVFTYIILYKISVKLVPLK